ncbi:MAG: methylenetetrahydrofolate reductase [NAD(P)H] [Spirochaetes bacterium]|nr:methylenetetrahydrofolate reductase [NAD(P)H] [Spirochaetota bacterium]
MTSITELYRRDFINSFEIFPPKTPQGEATLWREMEILAQIKPGFISVTYGAGGSTQEKTLDIAGELNSRFGIDPLVHFTCVGAGRSQIRDYIKRIESMRIRNILALRGDPPQGQTTFTPPADGFSHANELVEFLRSINGFTIAVAGYPEGHIESPDLDTDIGYLKKKVDAGADIILTQLFYDNNDFYSFIDRTAREGIQVPIIPGIMPVTSPGQIERITGMCGAKIPPALAARLQRCGTNEEICRAGIEYSIEQCRELKSWGVRGFHFYTLNRSSAVMRIIESL